MEGLGGLKFPKSAPSLPSIQQLAARKMQRWLRLLSSSARLPAMNAASMSSTVRKMNKKIALCRRRADFVQAEIIFTRMKTEGIQPDVVTVNTMLDVYGAAQLWKEQDRLLKMYQNSLTLDERTFGTLLKHCVACEGGVERAEQLSKTMADLGLEHNVITVTTMLDVYGAAGVWEGQDRLVKEHESLLNEQTFGTLLKHCVARQGGLKRAREIWEMMEGKGIQVNLVTLTTMLDVCGHLELWEEQDRLLEHYKNAVTLDKKTFGILLKHCVDQEGGVPRAEALLRRMKAEDVPMDRAMRNTMLDVYGFNWKQQDRFLSEHGGVDQDAFGIRLKYCVGQKGGVKRAEKVFNELKRKSSVNTVTLNTMLDVYGCANEIERQDELLRTHTGTVKTNEQTFNILLKACVARENGLARAKRLLEQMKRQKMKADTVTVNTMLDVYGCAECWDELDCFLQEHERRVPLDKKTFGTLLKHCVVREDGVQRAEDLLEKMIQRGVRLNSVILNIMLDVYGSSGLWKEQDRMMEENKEWVDEQTFNILLKHCVAEKSGVERAEKILRSLSRSGLSVDSVTLNTMRSVLDASTKSHTL